MLKDPGLRYDIGRRRLVRLDGSVMMSYQRIVKPSRLGVEREARYEEGDATQHLWSLRRIQGIGRMKCSNKVRVATTLPSSERRDPLVILISLRLLSKSRRR